MVCVPYRSKPMSLREAKLAAGFALGGFLPRKRCRTQAEQEAQEKRLRAEEDRLEAEIIGGDIDGFLCASDIKKTDLCWACGYIADLLCDYPMGRGKTCDLALCDEHAREIGQDRHLCLIHFAEFQKRALTDQIRPWPPKRGSR